MDTVIGCVTDLLPDKPALGNPNEIMKSVLNRFRNINIEDHKRALCDAVQIARYHADVLRPHLNAISMKLVDFLNNQRVQNVRLACQSAGELFRTMRCTDRPMFDNIVVALMYRTADKNQQLRIDANWALDKMVMSVPSLMAIKAMANCRHKNPAVKIAQLRLMHCVTAIVDPIKLLTAPGLREARRLVLNNCVAAVEDANADIRFMSKKLLQLLKITNQESFSSALVQDISWNELKIAEKNLNVEDLTAVLKKTSSKPTLKPIT
ncbi:uncharacterized protein LOC126843302 [Adelges cooleyi]|uniref:uncharacterized protein LOC126843302 n=1 Tax=Adelges cooleyi TaxID=133065 RepID=UPI0021802774|nr:uncharacterized protein LOC126843302 [Adelges cooleyi]